MYFKFNDISIYYEKYGNSSNPILILPGWGHTRTTFFNIINHFKENHTVYILDYPGFGNSPIPNKDLTIYDYTNLIRGFIKEVIKDSPIIIAHSFGGRISTLLTGYYKENIKKLILIDVAPIKKKKTLKQFLREKTYKFLKKLLKFVPLLKREYYRQKLLNHFGSSDYNSLPNGMHQTFKNIISKDLKCYLNKCEAETLIIWGEKDKATPLKDAYTINKLIKDSALIIYPKASHFSYLDYPLLTNKILDSFINEKAS